MRMYPVIRRLIGAAGMLAATSLLALLPFASASASNIGGPWTVTPISGSAQAMHFHPAFDGPNWNYRATAHCTDGTVLYGGWHAFNGDGGDSNTGNCNTGGHGHMDAGGFDYRQSDPLSVPCWSPGAGRSGSCSN